MGISSIILGILAFFIGLTIFKDLSLILAVLGIVLGGISLFRKKNKGLCIAGIILGVISLVIVFSNTGTTTEVSSSNTDGNTQNCKIGDTVIVKNSTEEYTLQITDVKESSDRNEFSEKTPSQVFLIDYNYVCNKAEDGVYVDDMNFKIIDENGEVGYTYPIDATSPQRVSAGVTCKAQMAFGVNNSSKKIKLQFFDNMFDGTPTAVYEIEL